MASVSTSRTGSHYGGLEFAPNAGLATREEQIIVGERIYDDYGWYAWGCARTPCSSWRPTGRYGRSPWSSSHRRRSAASMDRFGIAPKKSLGQNFLADPNTARRIVRSPRSSRVTPCSRSVPGSARSRRAGRTRARDVRAVELDATARGRAGRARSAREPDVDVRVADALDASTSTSCSPIRPGRAWRASSNLPYNVAMPGGGAPARGGAAGASVCS